MSAKKALRKFSFESGKSADTYSQLSYKDDMQNLTERQETGHMRSRTRICKASAFKVDQQKSQKRHHSQPYIRQQTTPKVKLNGRIKPSDIDESKPIDLPKSIFDRSQNQAPVPFRFCAENLGVRKTDVQYENFHMQGTVLRPTNRFSYHSLDSSCVSNDGQAQTMEKSFFIHAGHKLIQFRNSEDTFERATLNIKFARLRKIKVEYSGQKYYGFQLMARRRQYFFFVESKLVQYQWMRSLSKSCVKFDIQKDYDIGAVIGHGSFAQVKVCKRKATQKDYAVKILSKELIKKDWRNLHSIIKEIDVLRDLTHDNIVPLYEVYESEQTVYLVTKLLDGGQLFDRIMDGPTYSEEQAKPLIRKFFSALAYMHEKQIVHHDLKPQNLMLQPKDDGTEDIQIIDYGLASYMPTNGRRLFLRCGSPGYVAPELLASRGYDMSADIFSAGAILYLMLSGQPCFNGTRQKEILARNKKGDVSYPAYLWRRVSPQAKAFVQLLLEKDPTKRLTAAQALQHEWLQQPQMPISTGANYPKPLFLRALLTYSNRGSLLSGHFINISDRMLQYRSYPARLIVPMLLDVHAVKGYKLGKMLQNAVGFALFINRDNWEAPGQYAHFVNIKCGKMTALYRPGMFYRTQPRVFGLSRAVGSTENVVSITFTKQKVRPQTKQILQTDSDQNSERSQTHLMRMIGDKLLDFKRSGLRSMLFDDCVSRQASSDLPASAELQLLTLEDYKKCTQVQLQNIISGLKLKHNLIGSIQEDRDDEANAELSDGDDDTLCTRLRPGEQIAQQPDDYSLMPADGENVQSRVIKDFQQSGYGVGSSRANGQEPACRNKFLGHADTRKKTPQIRKFISVAE